MMKASQVLETCLYAEDLESAKHFYSEILGLALHAESPDRHVFFRCGQAMILLFNPSATATKHPGLDVPTHGARGPGHCCFAVTDSEMMEWKDHLERKGVPLEQEIAWPQGGQSIYFRDPAGNSLEFATRRVWGLPE